MSGGAPPGWRWQMHEMVASTQGLAIAAAEAGDGGRLAILAARQSAGRGSRGRAWESPAGNLHLSVLLTQGGAPDPGRWALLAGVALHAALAPFAAGTLMLKWPNDVLLDGAKLGGILIDSRLAADGQVAWVVIGFGANLAAAPAIGRPVACMPAPAREVAEAVVASLEAHGGAGTEAVCAAWLARAHPVGTMLDVRMPSRRVAGAFDGLTARGELRLVGCDAPISSGEVFF